MAEYAIVIGINTYANPAWNLEGAVDDALNFTEWLCQDRKVPPENIRLHLSPVPAGGAATVKGANGTEVFIPVKGASRTALIEDLLGTEVIDNSWAKDGDVLWFYFAGHGCSHANIRGENRTEPVLLPEEYERVRQYTIPIGFSEIIEPLSGRGPQLQYFFLDACRDFLVPEITAISPGIFRYMSNLNPGVNQQFIICACGPGERAAELGNGIFGSLLLSGLRGDARAVVRRAGAGDYVLTFVQLCSFLKREVAERLKRLQLKVENPFIQVPLREGAREEPPDLTLFSEDEIERTPFIVRVTPEDAYPAAQVKILYEGRPLDPPNQPQGPPLKAAHKFELLPSFYKLEVTAPGFKYEEPPSAFAIPLIKTCKVALVPTDDPPVPFGGPPAPGMTPQTSDGKRSLQIWCHDALASFVVTSPGKEQTRAMGWLILENPQPGMYQAQFEGPDGLGPAQWIDYPAMTRVEIVPPPPMMGGAQLDELKKRNMISETRAGFANPSELLPDVAGLSAGSILAYAAYAAYCQEPGSQMVRLQSFGLPPLPEDRRGEAWLTVVVGAQGDRPAGRSIESFLMAGRIVVSNSPAEGEPFTALQGLNLFSGYPAAAYAQVAIPAGGATVGLLLPELLNTRHAITVLNGRSTVFIITVDDSGSVATQIFSFPLWRPGADTGASFLYPDMLRLIELAQRFYAGVQDLPKALIDRVIAEMLHLKMREPFAGCLVGYQMIRLGRGSEYLGAPAPVHDGTWDWQSPMQNMLHFYPEVPDVHVLAALLDKEHADDHFSNAMAHGVPLFREGFQALLEWNDRVKSHLPKELLRARRTLFGSHSLSTWMGWQPVLDITNGRMEDPPRAWQSLEKYRATIERCAGAVGSLRRTDDETRPIVGTAFLIGGDLIMTTEYVVSSVGSTATSHEESPFVFRLDGDAMNPAPAIERKVVRIEALDKETGLALLRLDSVCEGVHPLVLDRAKRPHPSQAIFLVGYPCFDSRMEPERLEKVFESKFGLKRIMPGVVLAAPKDKDRFDYDCSTIGGVGGSPVINLEDGALLGVHWASMDDAGYRRGRAVSLWKRLEGGVVTGYDFLERQKLVPKE